MNMYRIKMILKKTRVDEDLAKSFKLTRKALSHFYHLLSDKEELEAKVDLLREALEILEQKYEKLQPGELEPSETLMALRNLMELLPIKNTRLLSYLLHTVHQIILQMPSGQVTEMHAFFVKLFHSYLRQIYQQCSNGGVMIQCLQILYLYVHKFPDCKRDAIIAEIVESVTNDDNLFALKTWKRSTVQKCSLKYANDMRGAKFFVLAVTFVTTRTGRNLKPSTGSKMYVEFNSAESHYSFEAREEQGQSAHLVVVPFMTIQKYEIINDDEGARVEVQLPYDKMRIHAEFAEDLVDLRKFLSSIIGERETNATSSLERIITYIRLNAFEESSISQADTKLTLEQSPISSIGLNDPIEPGITLLPEQKSISVGSVADTVEAYSCRNGASTIGVSKTAPQKSGTKVHCGTGAGNVERRNAKENNGCVRSDPYDIRNIRDEDKDVAPTTQGKKQKRSRKTNPKTNKDIQRKPPLVQSISQLRAKRANRSGNAYRSVRGNQTSSDEHDSESNNPDSDDLWEPFIPNKSRKSPSVVNRGQEPTRRPLTAVQFSSEKAATIKRGNGRGASVVSIEQIKYGTNNNNHSNSDDSDTKEIYDMVQQIRKNRIFDFDRSSSSVSIGKKRKSPAYEHTNDQGAFEHSAVMNGVDMVNERSFFSPVNMMLDEPNDTGTALLGLGEQSSQSNDEDVDRPPPSKLAYVLNHIANPTIKQLNNERAENMAFATNYIEPIQTSRQKLLDAMAQKQAVFLQEIQAATKTFGDLKELCSEFKRARPNDSQLEQMMKEATNKDDKLSEKLKNETSRIDKVIKEAVEFDWNCIKRAYANQLLQVLVSAQH